MKKIIYGIIAFNLINFQAKGGMFNFFGEDDCNGNAITYYGKATPQKATQHYPDKIWKSAKAGKLSDTTALAFEGIWKCSPKGSAICCFVWGSVKVVEAGISYGLKKIGNFVWNHVWGESS